MRPRIKSYDEAARFLERSNERDTGQRGTKVVRLTPTEIAVRYHNTDVVVYHHPQIVDKVATIDNGGWLTATTAARISEYAPDGITATLVKLPATGLEVMVLENATTGKNQSLEGGPFVVPREHSQKPTAKVRSVGILGALPFLRRKT